MAAKKKRGLSGTPEEHGRRAQMGFDMLTETLSEKPSTCLGLFRQAIDAMHDYTQMSENARESHDPEIIKNSRIRWGRVHALAQNVEKKCLIGGSLSGMKRRGRK